MIVVNKKFKVIVITLLIMLEVASTYLMYRSFNNRNVVLDNVKLKGTNKNNGLAIMIEQEDGTYKESSSNAWPEEMMYNEEKSGCIDSNGKKIENSLTYEGGIATVNTNTTSYCYLYFDLIKDDVTIAVSTDGVEGTIPSSGAYTNSATCSSGNITWSDKYHRIEIGNLTKPTKCNLTFTKDTSTKTLLRTEVESKATTNANGYRYSGTNPDNYIWFNNEMWRIIGSIPTCLSSNCGTSENLIKIIRKDSLNEIAYDAKSSDYTGTWGSNTLYSLLNNYYFSASDGTSSSYCYGQNTLSKTKCDYTTIGIDSSEFYGKMVKQVYWNTGASLYHEVTANSAYTNEILTRTVLGYVGLMTAADYGYAANSEYHNTAILNYNTSTITGTNWLFSQGYEFTSIQSSYSANDTLTIGREGNMNCVNAYAGFSVRPVVYLDSSVFIISGTGKEADPYVIGM